MKKLRPTPLPFIFATAILFRKIERLIRERQLLDTAPLYLRDGSPIPDGTDPERVVFITRTFVEPPERVEVELLGSQELSSSDGVETQRQ